MNYFFHKDAEAELIHAVDYYEACQVGLGQDFALEIYLTIQRITAHPKAWPVMGQNIRRALVQRFPYGILYASYEEQLFIVAVMHLHREPEYWKNRNSGR